MKAHSAINQLVKEELQVGHFSCQVIYVIISTVLVNNLAIYTLFHDYGSNQIGHLLLLSMHRNLCTTFHILEWTT